MTELPKVVRPEPMVMRPDPKVLRPETVIGRIEFNKVSDSGKREEMATGSVRDTREGKGRYDLIAPRALHRLARHYENGARKYKDRNWEKGQPMSRCLDSAIRHLNKVLCGQTDEDHLAAAAWNIFAIMEFQERIAEGCGDEKLDDMPKKPVSPT